MSGIVAGVILKQKFCLAHTSAFTGYIDYLNREEAQRNASMEKFNIYHEYMGNPEKSTGLFTSYKDELDKTEKEEMKELFQVAQANQSVMWQTVISFDNRWLEKNNLLDAKNGFIDERELKRVVRKSINKMNEVEGISHATWTASIHYNTDNIHVHAATVEVNPMRPTIVYDGEEQYKGRVSMKTIEAGKRVVVNEIINEKENNLKINEIIRKNIVDLKKQRSLVDDPDIRQSFLSAFELFPNMDERFINYGRSTLDLRKAIDSISDIYLSKHHNNDLTQLKGMLEKQSQLYSEAYGEGQLNRSYYEGKMDDLRTRLGNAIIDELKGYKRGVEKKIRQVDITEITPRKEGSVKQTNDFGIDAPERNSLIDLPITREKQEIEVEEFIPLTQHTQEVTDTIIDPVQIDDSLWVTMTQSNDETLNAKNEIPVTVDLKEIVSTSERLSLYQLYKNDYVNIRRELGDGHVSDSTQARIKKGLENENPYILILQANRFLVGDGVDIDIDESQRLFEKAFEILDKTITSNEMTKGDQAYASFHLGVMYERGLGVEVDKEKAFECYVESGLPIANRHIASLHHYENGVEKDYEIAKEYYEESGENPYAYLGLADLYLHGKGVHQSTEQAEQYFVKAFNAFESINKRTSNKEYELRLGKMLLSGIGCDKDEVKAISYLEEAASKKHVEAQYLLAKYYIDQNTQYKLPSAITMLREIADADKSIIAQYELGKIYSDKNSIHYDLKLGMRYYEEASENGNIYAKYRLGVTHLSNEEDVCNPIRGFVLLRDLANDGHEYANLKLGIEFLKGEHIQRDLCQAVKHLSTAADHGNIHAKETLLDLESNPPSLRNTPNQSGLLDKALSSLKQSLNREVYEALRIQREYEYEQDLELGIEH